MEEDLNINNKVNKDNWDYRDNDWDNRDNDW